MKYLGTYNLKNKEHMDEMYEKTRKIMDVNQEVWDQMKSDHMQVNFDDIRQYSWATEATDEKGIVKLYAWRDSKREKTARDKLQNTIMRHKNANSDFLGDL